jgi:hypothetical protein
LILNPQTGYISPQFHCVYDDQFDTAGKDKNFSLEWAKKAGLVEEEEESSEDPAVVSFKRRPGEYQEAIVLRPCNYRYGVHVKYTSYKPLTVKVYQDGILSREYPDLCL